eukprot:scaffold311261_cov17-Tisochrysis_lutea.AAC.1
MPTQVNKCLSIKGAEDTINKPFAFEISTHAESMFFIADTEKVCFFLVVKFTPKSAHPNLNKEACSWASRLRKGTKRGESEGLLRWWCAAPTTLPAPRASNF